MWKWKKQKNDLGSEAEKLKTKRSRMGIDSEATSRTRRLLRKYRYKHYPLAEQNIVSDLESKGKLG